MSALFIALPLLLEHLPLPVAALPGRIDRFEQAVLQTGVPLAELPVVHRFTPGLYVREVTLRKGVIYTSREHLTQHPFVISAGEVTVFHDDGSKRRLKAPHTGITEARTRRAILVHEDCVWTTFHATQETDLEKIEAETVAPRASHLRDRHCLQPAVNQLLTP